MRSLWTTLLGPGSVSDLYPSLDEERKYPYNRPLTFYDNRFPIIEWVRFAPAGEEGDGWIRWSDEEPPYGVLLYITYDFRNYPWICNAEDLHPSQIHDLWWRMTGIAMEQLAGRSRS